MFSIPTQRKERAIPTAIVACLLLFDICIRDKLNRTRSAADEINIHRKAFGIDRNITGIAVNSPAYAILSWLEIASRIMAEIRMAKLGYTGMIYQ